MPYMEKLKPNDQLWRATPVKVGFFEKEMAKFSNLSNRHACEPKIVSEHLFLLNVINEILALF